MSFHNGTFTNLFHLLLESSRDSNLWIRIILGFPDPDTYPDTDPGSKNDKNHEEEQDFIKNKFEKYFLPFDPSLYYCLSSVLTSR